MIKRGAALAALGLSILLLMITVRPAFAHQPYFEDTDTTAKTPWSIADPTISLALYFTLDSPTDVDYFTFAGHAGQTILFSMSIPQIEGAEHFTPTLALLGPSLPKISLPAQVVQPAKTGALILRASSGQAPLFFEPFSRTRYWRRQQGRVTLPADGQYVVAIWSETGQVGRYTFAPGDREIFGGDPAFASKLRAYWTPVKSPDAPAPPTSKPDHCSHREE